MRHVNKGIAYSADGFHPNNLGHAAIAWFMAGAMVDIGLVPPPRWRQMI